MENTLGTITRNVTTTKQSIDILKIFGSREVAVISQDEDNNIFFQPNPNSENVLTANVDVAPEGLIDELTYQIEEEDIVNFAVGDVVIITTLSQDVYNAKITAVDSTSTNKSITIEAVSGLNIDDTDTITCLCYKLPANFPVVVRGSLFVNGFFVKHKDSTDTASYQLVLMSSDHFNSTKLSPFFFESKK